MDLLNGTAIGKVNITVYETPDGKRFFYLKASNKNVLPIAYIVEDTLYNY